MMHSKWLFHYLQSFFTNSHKIILLLQGLGKHGITCIEDLVHGIMTVGSHFKEANNFLWPFKLKAPLGGLKKKRNHYVEGGDAGNREDYISEPIRRMNQLFELSLKPFWRKIFNFNFSYQQESISKHCILLFLNIVPACNIDNSIVILNLVGLVH